MTTHRTALDAFGGLHHDGICCPCGEDLESGVGEDIPSLRFRFTLRGVEYVSDSYVAIRADLLTGIPADLTEPTVDESKFCSVVTGPASGFIGWRALQVLDRWPDAEVADSDLPGMFAITNGNSRMIGFTNKGHDGLPAPMLGTARRVAAMLQWAIGETRLAHAGRALAAAHLAGVL